MSKIIVYSHGFGVEKTDRGLFTDISLALENNAQQIMFDYNQSNVKDNTLTVSPLNKQIELLDQKIGEAKKHNPGATIDLICHSQGCVVAAMLQPEGVGRIIFLAPPAKFMGAKEKLEQMKLRPGTKINEDGTASYPRRDGSTTIIKQDYWDSLNGVKPIELYNLLSDKTTVTIINANQDEVLGSSDFSELSPKINVLNIDANHDFTGDSREKLVSLVVKEVS